jgi:MFS family permease
VRRAALRETPPPSRREPRLRPIDAGERAPESLRPALTVWGAWLVLMAGVNLATPLYAVYAARFGFSSLVLTAVFAAYAFALVPALLLFGRLSDRFGRRPVLLVGLAVACAGLGLFAAARGTAWLFGARAVQGLAVGMISGAATAALVELDPRHDRRRAAMFAGLAQAGGSAAGPLLAGVLVEWAPAPRQLSFLVALAATGAAAAFVLALPEPAPGEHEPWRVQWPRVPAEIRWPFVRVSVTAAIVWASVALFLSIVPSYAAELLRNRNAALLAAVAAIALAASCVSLVVSRRLRIVSQRQEASGLGLLGTGLVLLAFASPLRSLAVLVLGAIAAGAGHGLGFLNAQEELNDLAPGERRGEVTAAFIACIYFVVASAVIGTGLLDLRFSLSVSVGAVAVGLAVAALCTAAWQARVSAR